MDRESLRPLVEAQMGESRLTVLSEETINAELDDALIGITDDAQVDDVFAKRIAERLKRINGNVTKEAGTQINAYKKAHPKPSVNDEGAKKTTPEGGEGSDAALEELQAQVKALQNSLKEKAAQEAASAVMAEVRNKFNTIFLSHLLNTESHIELVQLYD